MINIVLAVHDKYGTYCKYAAVTIVSIFENTKEKITMHLLHDETVSKEAITKFKELCNGYGNNFINYCIDVERFKDIKADTGAFTIGTLFRFMIPNLITAEKVIYLDADIIVNLDISLLWNEKLGEGRFIGACQDHGLINKKGSSWVIDNDIVEREKYFNAGVMLLDLKQIRTRHDFFTECVEYLADNKQLTLFDQDTLNALYKENVQLLDGKYNVFSRCIRGVDKYLKPCIYHFPGDFIDQDNPECFDDLFLHYLSKTPWGTFEEVCGYFKRYIADKHEREKTLQVLVKMTSKENRKKIIFGCGSVLLETIESIIALDADRDYFVDNNKKKWHTTYKGMEIKSPEVILKETRREYVVIILSKKYCNEIKTQLNSYGLVECEDYVDGRNLISLSQGGYGGYY